MLALTLLGTFRARVDGRAEPLRLPTQKAVALLAYLALRDEPRVSRNALATLLWKDVPLSQGRHSLRQELTHIRTALGPDASTYLHADRDSVDLRLDRISVDVDQLIELIARHTSESIRDACALYRGELLTGLHTRERAFDAWLESTRSDIKRLAVIAHEYRLDELTGRADTTETLTVARQLVTIDPSSEAGNRWLMTKRRASDHPHDGAHSHRVRTGAADTSRRGSERRGG